MTQVGEKPKRPAGERTGPELSPDEQKRRFAELCDLLGTDRGEALDEAFGKIVPPKLRVVEKNASPS